jgi:hypothetical protein
MDPTGISKLIFNPVGGDPLPQDWNAAVVAARPTYIVVRNDGTVLGSCSSQQHPPG